MKDKLFSKNYLFIIAVSAFAYTSSFMIMSASPKWCVALGGTKAVSGVLASAHTVSALVFRPLWGKLSDTAGRKRIFYTGIFVGLCALALFFTAHSIALLFVSRIVFGAGFSAVTTAGGTIVTDIIPKSRYSEGLAFYGTASILSQSLASPIALFLYDYSFEAVLIAVTASWAVCLICGIAVKYSEKKMLKTGKGESGKKGLFEKRALPAAVTVMFMSLGNASVATFLPLMGEERGIKGVGIFFTLSACGLFLTRVIGRKLPQKLGDNRAFYGSMFFYVCAFTVLIFAKTRLLTALAGICYGIGIGFGFPILNSAAVRGVEAENRGRATSTYMATQDAGTAIGAAIWGAIADRHSFSTVYTWVLAAAACLIISYTVLVRPAAGQKKKIKT